MDLNKFFKFNLITILIFTWEFLALVTRTFTDHTIVFIRTKKECEHLSVVLGLLGVRSAALHGGLNQAKRVQALADFKAEKVDVLCSTDLAARGLDVEGVLTVGEF